MSQLELLRFVARLLDRLDVDWMLVGSHASSFYGEPRSTHDIDLVVDLPPDRIPDLLSSLPDSRYYLSEAALREGRMANLIDIQTGDKVDLFLVAGQPRGKQELARRLKVAVAGVEVFIASLEDTIIAKLRWFRETGGSERQVRDVRAMLVQQGTQVDFAFLRHRIEAEGLDSVWQNEIQPWLDENS